jgi:hypothetical protein
MKARWTVLLICALGCGSPESQSPHRTSSPEEVGRRIASALINTPAPPACGRSDPLRLPTTLLPVSAEHCLSCLDVGHLFRESDRDIRRGGGNRHIVVAARDSAEVCGFIRREKVKLPVLVVADSNFSTSSARGPLLFVAIDAYGRVTQVDTAGSGMQLLQKVRGQVPPSTARGSR